MTSSPLMYYENLFFPPFSLFFSSFYAWHLIYFRLLLNSMNVGYILGTPINKRIDIFFSLIGCALYIACGILVFKDWDKGFNDKIDSDAAKYAKSKAGLSIVQGVLFLIDVFFTFRDQTSFSVCYRTNMPYVYVQFFSKLISLLLISFYWIIRF